MPKLSASLGRRVANPGASRVGAGRMSLADLPRGRSATIVELHAKTDPATARRLFDLGFVPGALVEMVRRAPLTDPVVFAVAGYEIALRRAQARLIDVTVTA